MKVLIVSHNVLSPSSAMGKTLLSYFSDFSPDELAQFYIHSEVPIDASVCTRYYRFTDLDALWARLPCILTGHALGAADIRTDRASARTDTGTVGSLYQYGRRRSPLIYAARNLVWKTAFWKSPALKTWLRETDPDVIFFASGDYSFLYDAACWMADTLRVPLVVSCMDDYYCNNINADRFLGGFLHRQFLRHVRRTMEHAQLVLVICDAMREAYAARFPVRCETLYTGAKERAARPVPERGSVSYLGNLGHLRHRALIEVGRALQAAALPDGPRWIDVYSAEKRPKILNEMTEENGIHFHGMISAEETAAVMAHSMAVLHVESFDEKEMARVRFSVSTKIADSLMNGPCLIAYGPEGIASVDYLRTHEAAWVISDPEQLESALRVILTDPALRAGTVERARALAQANHRADAVSQKVHAWLQEVIEE